MSPAPLVSVLVSAHEAERFLRPALESVLRQTLRDLELIVVDDGSREATREILRSLDDPRLTVLRNDVRVGLAASLNRALDAASGRYVARLDADDVALPCRLERQVAELESRRRLGLVGTAVLELDARNRPGALHLMPIGSAAVRWASLFGSPFFHPSVMLDRGLLDREGLRYDPEFLESEDYELWTRVLRVTEGDNLPEPLVLYRVHERQASSVRSELQRDFQRRVALREITRTAPALSPQRAELAWQVGAGVSVAPVDVREAVAAFVELAEASGAPRLAAARSLATLARSQPRHARDVLAAALALDPALVVRGLARSARRTRVARTGQRQAERWLSELELETAARPVRVTAVFPEPTPYRAPLLDRIAALPDLELTVVYAAETVARRTWRVEPRHRAIFLRGVEVPGAARILRHDYPLTPGIGRALEAARPDVVVVSGWSTFAAQAAILWSKRRRLPYVLVVESHDEGPRPGWRRWIKGAVVPRVVRGASGVLVTGKLARRSMLARGAAPSAVRVFANTVDVEAFAARAHALAPHREELREELGARDGDVVVLSVGRLAPEKGMDDLLRAVSAADGRLLAVLAGDGPERGPLERLAKGLRVRAVFTGDRPWERISELYVAADVFALLSTREPWGVVVNEAAACGLPLLLADAVGAAHDLLHDGENGFLVRAGDVSAAAEALRRLESDPACRAAFGARSREIAREWGYEPSVDAFVAAVREAAAARRR